MEFKGIVEGFYGKPWTIESRIKMMNFLGTYGYNIYIYAPKDDPFHRSKWREPYPAQMMDDFKKLAIAGKNSNVKLGIAISPGLSLTYSDPEEVQTFVRKAMQFYEMNINIFGLFFDDIPQKLQKDEDIKKFSDLAQAQVHFTHEVYKNLKSKIPDLKFIVCPTIYNGDGSQDYVQTLGKMLDPHIYVMWTGPQCCPQRITEKDAILAENALRRKPLYWDNYPVNDGYMSTELHIGPYMNREAKVLDHACGFVLNPMNQSESSKIPLATAAYFFENPQEYDPKKAFKKVLSDNLSIQVFDAFYRFSNYNVISPIHPENSNRANRLIDNFKRFMKIGKMEEAISILQEEALSISNDLYKMRKFLDQELLDELKQWLDEYEEWGICLKNLTQHLRILWEMESSGYNGEKILLLGKSLKKLNISFRNFTKHRTSIFNEEMVGLIHETIVKSSIFFR